MINCKNTFFRSTLFSVLFLTSLILADPTDGCELDTNQLFLTSSGDVLFNSNTDIAGFQFTVDGTTASGASGGAAADAGFTVSAGGVVISGLKHLAETGVIKPDEVTVAYFTGNGLKTQEAVEGLVNPMTIDPTVESFREVTGNI